MAAYAGKIDRRKGRKEGGSSNRAEEKREGRFFLKVNGWESG